MIRTPDPVRSLSFDAVVFGHTHHPGVVEAAPGKYYLNTGSWLMGSQYAEIKDGSISLRNWEGGDTGIPIQATHDSERVV